MRAPREMPAVTRGSDALLTTSTRFPVEPVTAAPRPACKSVSTGSLARKAVRCEVVCGPGSKPADSWPCTGACPTPLRLSLRFFRTAQQNSIAQWTFVTDSVAPALPTRDLRPGSELSFYSNVMGFCKTHVGPNGAGRSCTVFTLRNEELARGGPGFTGTRILPSSAPRS